MVPAEGFGFEDQDDEEGKDHQGDHLLDHFELPDVEGTSISFVANAVGGNLEDVFKESDAPASQDDGDESVALEPGHLAEFQMAIPGHGHEGVGEYQQEDSG